MCSAYEEELRERTLVYMHDYADVVLDLSPLATFAFAAEARRLERRQPRLQRRLLDLLKDVRLASPRTVFNFTRSNV